MKILLLLFLLTGCLQFDRSPERIVDTVYVIQYGSIRIITDEDSLRIGDEFYHLDSIRIKEKINE